MAKMMKLYKVVRVHNGRFFSVMSRVPQVEYVPGETIASEFGPLMCFNRQTQAMQWPSHMTGDGNVYVLLEVEAERFPHSYRCALYLSYCKPARVKRFWDPRYRKNYICTGGMSVHMTLPHGTVLCSSVCDIKPTAILGLGASNWHVWRNDVHGREIIYYNPTLEQEFLDESGNSDGGG